jgi:hypothetical protein
MHAAASVLVLLLAQQLFACLEAPPVPPSPTTKPPPAAAAGPSHSPPRAPRGGRQSPAPGSKRGNATSSSRGADAGRGGAEQWDWSDWVQWRWQPSLWRVGSPSAQLQAWVCALLFALHPVHTEVGGQQGWRSRAANTAWARTQRQQGWHTGWRLMQQQGSGELVARRAWLPRCHAMAASILCLPCCKRPSALMTS